MIKRSDEDKIIQNRQNLPYASQTSDPPIRLVDRAREIEEAGISLQSHAHAKLSLIAKQIRNLQEEAENILTKAQEDYRLHQIACNFEKKAGMLLHLYEKGDGNHYFSLLSPEEWGRAPHKFVSSYRLGLDMSFEPIVKTEDLGG